MCNDYGLNAPLSLINQRFGQVDRPLLFPEGAPNLAARDDIWPTETAPIVRAGAGGTELAALRWGFAPGGSSASSDSTPGKAQRGRPPVINFRSEGRRFSNTASGGRCLIPASHFYEFTAAEPALGSSQGDAKSKRALKTKWAFRLAESAGAAEGDLFCIAGLWRGATGETPAAYSMLTCAPGPDVAPIHDRQIVVLKRGDWARWLDGDAEEAAALLRPSPAGTFSVARVER